MHLGDSLIGVFGAVVENEGCSAIEIINWIQGEIDVPDQAELAKNLAKVLFADVPGQLLYNNL